MAIYRRTLKFTLKPLVASLLAIALPAQAATHVVHNEADLVAAINAINGSVGANFIEFKSDITLTGALPPITGTVTIKGHNKTLSGDTDGDGMGDVPLLVVGSNVAPGTSVLVQISGLTLKDGLAMGSAGSGDNGSGGALQINQNADVVLKDVKILNSHAVGGTGVAPNGDGGNGLGGAIYVAPGGRLSMAGSVDAAADPLSAPANIGSSTAIGGTADGTGSNGVGAGGGLFLDGSGNLRLSANPNSVLAIHGDISDNVGSGLGVGTWNLLLEGGGGSSTDTTDPNATLNFGTIVMGGSNTYSGDTYISDVNVGISSMGALGSGGVVALDNGGLIVAAGVDVNRELVLASGGGRIGVFSGAGTLSGDVTGTGNLMKVGEGDLALLGNSNFDGDWRVREGALVLDSNARLGALPDLILDGGGLKLSADVNDLRGFEITNRGGYIDTDSHNAVLAGKIEGWNGDVTLTFRDSAGGGTTTLSDSFSYGVLEGTGHSHIESGTVIGNIAKGNLTVDVNSEYQLGGKDRTVRALLGDGKVALNNNTLNIALSYDPAGGAGPSFTGQISGTGALVISNPLSGFSWTGQQLLGSLLVDTGSFLSQELAGGNTYSGGTTVERGALLNLADPSSIGSGALTLKNGALGIASGNFNMDIYLAGNVGILEASGDVDFYGELIGSADFLKQGSGTLTLHSASNNMSGRTVVAGSGSYVALADADALGSGSLVLSDGGGLKLLQDTAELRPIKIESGRGIIDTGNYTVTSSGNISGVTGLAALLTSSRLVKEGAGDLILTGSVSVNGGLEVSQGTVQLGNGGSTGSFTSGSGSLFGAPADIVINSGASLVVNRSNSLTLMDDINGGGELIKKGAGTLTLEGNNTFDGGLTVLEGYVSGLNAEAYGGGTILLDGGGLKLVSDLNRDISLGSNDGRLQVAGLTPRYFSGQLLGAGDLLKTGTGTLIYTGVATSNIHVQQGVLQVGDGYIGTLLSDVEVDAAAELVFSRDDLTQYDGVVSGSGDVIKRGLGELVLTGDHLFTGDIGVENGIVRLGNGGGTGSLMGGADIAAGAELAINRSGNADIIGSLKGAGTLRQVGTGQLRLPGDSSAFAGNTVAETGSLRIDGILGGDVEMLYGTRLQGVGSILGDLSLRDGAIFSPGNSFGTFTVAGNYVMDSGSQLRIEIDELGGQDDVQVGGTATLAGTLRIMPQAGVYAAGCCSYTILQATGGVIGTFDQVTNDLAFLNTTVTYNPNDVVLSVARNGSGFGSLGNLSWNQQQVSGALDAIDAIDPTNALVAAITPLSIAQARSAYDELHGDSLLAAGRSASHNGQRFTHALAQRASRLGLASRGAGTSETRAPTAVVEGIWLENTRLTNDSETDSQVGSAAFTHDSDLLALGFDGYWSDDVVVGFAFGQTSGDLSFSNRSASGTQKGWTAGAYSRFETRSGMHFKVALGMGQSDTDFRRSIALTGETAKSTINVTTTDVVLEAGFGLHAGNYGFRPFVLANAQMLKRDAINETGATLSGLDVVAENNLIGEIGLGLELSRPWLTGGNRWAQLQGSFSLLQPVGDTQLQQTAQLGGTTPVFTVTDTAEDTPILAINIGGEIYLTPGLALWGGYESRFSSASNNNGLQLSMRYRW